jgi:hypothetical protein
MVPLAHLFLKKFPLCFISPPPKDNFNPFSRPRPLHAGHPEGENGDRGSVAGGHRAATGMSDDEAISLSDDKANDLSDDEAISLSDDEAIGLSDDVAASSSDDEAVSSSDDEAAETGNRNNGNNYDRAPALGEAGPHLAWIVRIQLFCLHLITQRMIFFCVFERNLGLIDRL